VTPVEASEETAADPTSRVGWWAVVRDAIRGVHHDYTRGSIGRSIVMLAIPMVLEMAMESIFAVVDVFWVSRLGPDAVATVGLTESMLTLVYTAAMGLSIGVIAVVARRTGEKRPEEAAEAAVQGIALGVVVAATVAAPNKCSRRTSAGADGRVAPGQGARGGHLRFRRQRDGVPALPHHAAAEPATQ
jgi:hypothetical protein